ncbi:MAG: hypothetical protein PUD70_03735 [Firmicutes bacterium]|nr:hypothetical protein [Clostridiales bacterium]MDD5883179.1 hypothetical protein [Bacillota bacterium]
MTFFLILLIAAAVFGLCFAVDKAFSKLFRSKAQHRSGMAVRANKRYGLFGVILSVLGIMAVCVGISDGPVLLWGGVIVLLMGAALAVYYLSFGVFYDGETFLLSRFGKKEVTYRFSDIKGQKLYLVQGGNVVIELHMADGNTVSLQSTMDGVYPFLDTAFAAWCLQTGRDPQSCDFHDPSQSLWFPPVEDI